MTDRRKQHSQGVTRGCDREGCSQWHRLQIPLTHDTHEALKSMADRSRFPTMAALVENTLDRLVAGHEPGSEPEDTAPSRSIVEVQLSQLETATLADLRRFRMQFGLTGRTKKEILAAAQACDWVIVR